jgi:hypothetical protein
MATAEVVRSCRKADCKVAAGGSCAEGHQPTESCPNFGQQVDADLDEDSGVDVVERVEMLDLPNGEALSIELVDRFLRWRPARFITVIGERDSGKTTLICSLYDRFLKGTFAGFRFAESWTLLGFERRSHYSRVVSGLSRPDTAHTSIQDGVQFLHLGVARLTDALRHDLMFADRAGETYAGIRAKPDTSRKLVELGKSDRLVLLVDGARVAEPSERAGALQAVRQTLRALLQEGVAGADTIVQVVTSKLDVIHNSPKRAAIEDRLTEFRAQMTEAFASALAGLSFWDTAARAPEGSHEPAFGVGSLLDDWTRPSDVASPTARPAVHLATEYDRLLSRPVGGILP